MVVVNSVGLGTKRGILIDTNVQNFNTNEVVYRITSAGGLGSYVAAEINIASGNLNLRRCTLSGSTFYLQTAGSLNLIDTDLSGTANSFSFPLRIYPTSNQIALGNGNTTTINAPIPASNIILTLPLITDTLVGRNTGDIMTNKTITDTTNNVAANSLKSATTLINVSAATAPSSGQLLIATSSTTATWQNISGGLSVIAPTAATDANGAILSGSTLQLEFATATNPGILSVAAQTLAGAKTFSSAVIINPVNNQIVLGVTNTTTINAVAPASSRTYSMPDTGANSSFVMTDGTQTINGSKTFSSAVIINPVTNQVVLGTTNTTTITAPAPASNITLTLPNSASDTIVARNTTDTMTNKRLSDTTTSIVNAADITKSIAFNVAGATTATATNLFFAQTTTKNITFPDISDTLITKNTNDILTNKTITSTTNNVAANSLKSATTLVDVAAATAPSSGQILTATSSTTATWQANPTLSVSAPIAATDANGVIVSGHNLQLEFATATNPGILSVAAQTLVGAKTFSSAVIISPVNNQITLGTTNTTTINAVAPASSRTYSIPDTGANSSFVMTDGTQTINGSKTFSSAVIINPVTNQITLGTTILLLLTRWLLLVVELIVYLILELILVL